MSNLFKILTLEVCRGEAEELPMDSRRSRNIENKVENIKQYYGR